MISIAVNYTLVHKTFSYQPLNIFIIRKVTFLYMILQKTQILANFARTV